MGVHASDVGQTQLAQMFTLHLTFFLTSGRSFQDLFASLFQVSVQQLANYDTEAKQRAKEGKVFWQGPSVACGADRYCKKGSHTCGHLCIHKSGSIEISSTRHGVSE